MDFPFFSLKTVFVIYLWMLVVARWLLIRDVQSHMGLCCCLWCPTKSASASVVTPTCTERALRGIPPCQGETSHSNKDSSVLNNTFTVGLHNRTRTCCVTYNLCAGLGCNQKRPDKAYGAKQQQWKKSKCEQEKEQALKQLQHYTMLWHHYADVKCCSVWQHAS